MWNIIKTIMNKRNNQNKIVAININDQLTNNPDIIANSFNSFFSSVAENIIKKCPGSSFTLDPITYLNSNIIKPQSLLQLNLISSHETENLIQSLKSKDSHGHDEISTRILKICTPYIVSPLTFIFNRVL